MVCKHGETSCVCTQCDLESLEVGLSASKPLLGCTCTADAPKTHKQEMLAALHDADVWHAEKAGLAFTKSAKQHARFQEAIWWAIEQLDDEILDIKVT